MHIICTFLEMCMLSVFVCFSSTRLATVNYMPYWVGVVCSHCCRLDCTVTVGVVSSAACTFVQISAILQPTQRQNDEQTCTLFATVVVGRQIHVSIIQHITLVETEAWRTRCVGHVDTDYVNYVLMIRLGTHSQRRKLDSVWLYSTCMYVHMYIDQYVHMLLFKHKLYMRNKHHNEHEKVCRASTILSVGRSNFKGEIYLNRAPQTRSHVDIS